MSLAIDPAKVIRVLLADGWHDCAEGSLELDLYEFMGPVEQCGVAFPVFSGSDCEFTPDVGFTFRAEPSGGQVSGPITSILAVEEL
jgi:hypothetical protein